MKVFAKRLAAAIWLAIFYGVTLVSSVFAQDSARAILVADSSYQALPGDLKQLWAYQTNARTLGIPLSTPEWIYLPAGDGYIHALDSQSGIMRWKFKTTAPVEVPLTLGSERILAIDGNGCTLALDRHSGIQQWKFLAEERPVAAATLAQNLVLVTGQEGSLVALDRHRGKVRWRYRHQDRIAGQPGLVGSEILVLGRTGDTVWLNPKNGKILRRLHVPGWFSSGPTINNQQGFAADLQSRVWSFSKVGGIHWRFETAEGDKDFARSPLVTENLLLALAEDRTLFGISCGDGQRLWRFTARSPLIGRPALSLDQILLATGDGRLIVLDRETGRKSREFTELASLTNGPIWSQGKMLLTVEPATLIALGQR